MVPDIVKESKKGYSISTDKVIADILIKPLSAFTYIAINKCVVRLIS